MIKISATLEKFNNDKPKNTLVLRFATQEVSRDQAAEIIGMAGDTGWLLFAPNEHYDLNESDLPDRDAPGDVRATPSQAYRSKIFRLWRVSLDAGDTTIENFNTFYKAFIEKKIKELDEYLKTKEG